MVRIILLTVILLTVILLTVILLTVILLTVSSLDFYEVIVDLAFGFINTKEIGQLRLGNI